MTACKMCRQPFGLLRSAVECGECQARFCKRCTPLHAAWHEAEARKARRAPPVVVKGRPPADGHENGGLTARLQTVAAALLVFLAVAYARVALAAQTSRDLTARRALESIELDPETATRVWGALVASGATGGGAAALAAALPSALFVLHTLYVLGALGVSAAFAFLLSSFWRNGPATLLLVVAYATLFASAARALQQAPGSETLGGFLALVPATLAPVGCVGLLRSLGLWRFPAVDTGAVTALQELRELGVRSESLQRFPAVALATLFALGKALDQLFNALPARFLALSLCLQAGTVAAAVGLSRVSDFPLLLSPLFASLWCAVVSASLVLSRVLPRRLVPYPLWLYASFALGVGALWWSWSRDASAASPEVRLACGVLAGGVFWWTVPYVVASSLVRVQPAGQGIFQLPVRTVLERSAAWATGATARVGLTLYLLLQLLLLLLSRDQQSWALVPCALLGLLVGSRALPRSGPWLAGSHAPLGVFLLSASLAVGGGPAEEGEEVRRVLRWFGDGDALTAGVALALRAGVAGAGLAFLGNCVAWLLRRRRSGLLYAVSALVGVVARLEASAALSAVLACVSVALLALALAPARERGAALVLALASARVALLVDSPLHHVVGLAGVAASVALLLGRGAAVRAGALCAALVLASAAVDEPSLAAVGVVGLAGVAALVGVRVARSPRGVGVALVSLAVLLVQVALRASLVFAALREALAWLGLAGGRLVEERAGEWVVEGCQYLLGPA